MDTIASSPASHTGRREVNKLASGSVSSRPPGFCSARCGFEATTAAAIAGAANVGSGTFYLYFASKEDLLIDVFTGDVERIWDDAFTLVRPGDHIADQLLGVFERATSGHDRDPELSRVYFREMHFASTIGSGRGRVDHCDDPPTHGNPVRRRGRAGSARSRCPRRRAVTETLFDIWFFAMLRHYGHPTTAEEVRRGLERPLRMILDFMRPQATSSG